MSTKTIPLGLTRRIVVYYVLFCLVAVAWLAVGTVFVSQSVLHSRADSTCLSLLGRAASAATLAHVRDAEQGLQELVNRLNQDTSLTYAAVISADGYYLAHSDPTRVGEKVPGQSGAQMRWGAVSRLRYLDPQTSTLLREYQTPLVVDTRKVGTLAIAVPDSNLLNTLFATAQAAPIAILVPWLCIGLGVLVMTRLTSPLADIEQQLRTVQQAREQQRPTLEPVPVRTAASVGWNRIVTHLAQQPPSSDLQSKVNAVLESRRGSQVEQALQSLGEGLAVTDAEGRITFANAALAALLGDERETDKLIGASLGDLLPRECEEGSNQLLDRSLLKRAVVTELNPESAGDARIVRAARCPIRDSGQAKGHIWSFRDVTQQKLADKMRDQFLDSATHELRTPLANIKAYAETLALSKLSDPDKQKEFCNTINSEATRLSRFIDDLLDLSSIEVGSLSILRQNVHVDRLMREAVEKVRPLMDKKEITLDVSLQEKLPEMKLDKDKIATTLVNLLGNAAKYTPPEGRVMLRVSADQQRLRVEVEDTGVGISETDLPRVFEKFYRSADERIQDETGTGLGLSLAQEVVRLHGGELTAESVVDKGSTFTMTLPI